MDTARCQQTSWLLEFNAQPTAAVISRRSANKSTPVTCGLDLLAVWDLSLFVSLLVVMVVVVVVVMVGDGAGGGGSGGGV